jgi:hypothetical protein
MTITSISIRPGQYGSSMQYVQKIITSKMMPNNNNNNNNNYNNNYKYSNDTNNNSNIIDINT